MVGADRGMNPNDGMMVDEICGVREGRRKGAGRGDLLVLRPRRLTPVLLLHRPEGLTLEVGIGSVVGGVDRALLARNLKFSCPLLVELLGDHCLVLQFLLAILEHRLEVVGGVASLVLGAVEHVFLVADAVLLRLVLAGELGRVLELLETALLGGESHGAGIWRLAVGRQHVVRLDLLSVLELSILGQLLVALSSACGHVLGAELEGASRHCFRVPSCDASEQIRVIHGDSIL
ncbi:hypothetical protein PMAYCL1PPCAC_28220, partial [Pristionchus mayeri]